LKKIIYSPGEPSGIGPDLIIQLSCSTFWNQINIPIACIADPELLIDRANTLGKKIKIKEISNPVELKKNKRNEIQVIEIAKCPNTKYGKLHRSNAK
jgi:4-hydroxythreonine-4-phosphate dehydrogenase